LRCKTAPDQITAKIDKSTAMTPMGFTKLFNFSLRPVSAQSGHEKCCALFPLKSPLWQPPINEKVVERYAKEHLPNKIFT
jgi:hypothetical protein